MNTQNILKQVMKYADEDFDTCRLLSPRLTKREVIFLATDIQEIINAYIKVARVADSLDGKEYDLMKELLPYYTGD